MLSSVQQNMTTAAHAMEDWDTEYSFVSSFRVGADGKRFVNIPL
jgi:hypothetical protein